MPSTNGPASAGTDTGRPATSTDADRLVETHRSAPRRGAPPGRLQTGWSVTRRWFWVTAITVAAVTTTLVVVVVRT